MIFENFTCGSHVGGFQQPACALAVVHNLALGGNLFMLAAQTPS